MLKTSENKLNKQAASTCYDPNRYKPPQNEQYCDHFVGNILYAVCIVFGTSIYSMYM